MREPKNKDRTTVTLIGEDVRILIELQKSFEVKFKISLPYVEIVRKALREMQASEII